MSDSICSLSVSSEDLQQVDKDGDDVSVKNDSAYDVVIDFDFIALSTHDQLSVEKEVEAEEDDSDDAPDDVHGAAGERKEEDRGESQGEADHEQERAEDREIALCGEGIDGDADGHACSGEGSYHHNLGVETCGNEAHDVGLADGEDCQEDVVGGDVARD